MSDTSAATPEGRTIERFAHLGPPCNKAMALRATDKRVTPTYESSTCIYCGSAERVEVDHVEPLTRGGEHANENTVWCCRRCNVSKGNKMLLEWVVCGLSPFTTYRGEAHVGQRAYKSHWPRRRIVATDGYLEVLECGHRRTPRLLRRQMLMSDFCNATTRKCEECAA